MSHIRCTQANTFTPKVGRIDETVQDSWILVRDGLTCLTFGACTTKQHIYTKGGLDS
jgi:hypothetical protein